MSLQKINTRTLVLITMMLVCSLGRLISYKFPYELSNFTPMGAIALFGGSYFSKKWKAYAMIIVIFLLSDIFINYLYTSKLMLWYSGAVWTYIPFILSVFVGSFIKKVSVLNVGIASVGVVLIHWLFADLPWFYGTMYPHNMTGYLQSLGASFYPFECNMLAANLLFCAILFGGFELAKNKYGFLRSQKELAV